MSTQGHNSAEVEQLHKIIFSDAPASAKCIAHALCVVAENGRSIFAVSNMELTGLTSLSLYTIDKYRKFVDGRKDCLPKKQIQCPQKLRKRVREAFNYTCQYCGLRADPSEQEIIQIADGQFAHTAGWMGVDCIVPKARGGKYEPSNVTLACDTCNTLKGDREAPEGVLSLADVERLGGGNDG